MRPGDGSVVAANRPGAAAALGEAAAAPGTGLRLLARRIAYRAANQKRSLVARKRHRSGSRTGKKLGRSAAAALVRS